MQHRARNEKQVMGNAMGKRGKAGRGMRLHIPGLRGKLQLTWKPCGGKETDRGRQRPQEWVKRIPKLRRKRQYRANKKTQM